MGDTIKTAADNIRSAADDAMQHIVENTSGGGYYGHFGPFEVDVGFRDSPAGQGGDPTFHSSTGVAETYGAAAYGQLNYDSNQITVTVHLIIQVHYAMHASKCGDCAFNYLNAPCQTYLATQTCDAPHHKKYPYYLIIHEFG